MVQNNGGLRLKAIWLDWKVDCPNNNCDMGGRILEGGRPTCKFLSTYTSKLYLEWALRAEAGGLSDKLTIL